MPSWTVGRRNGRTLHGRPLLAYDAENHKIASKDANDKSMSWQYKDGRLKASIDMEGKKTEYGYDASGRLLWQTSERGQNLRYTYSGTNLVPMGEHYLMRSSTL